MHQMLDSYINKNYPLSDSSLVDTVILHHDVSYDPNLKHIDLDGKLNDKGVYRNFVTGKNTSTLHCYQVCKKGKVIHYHKVKTFFLYEHFYNSFTQNLGLEIKFEISDDQSDTKDDSTTNTNNKEGGNYGNGKVDDPNVKTIGLPADNAPQGFVS